MIDKPLGSERAYFLSACPVKDLWILRRTPGYHVRSTQTSMERITAINKRWQAFWASPLSRLTTALREKWNLHPRPTKTIVLGLPPRATVTTKRENAGWTMSFRTASMAPAGLPSDFCAGEQQGHS